MEEGRSSGERGSLPTNNASTFEFLMWDGYVSPCLGLDSLGVRVRFGVLDLGPRV